MEYIGGNSEEKLQNSADTAEEKNGKPGLSKGEKARVNKRSPPDRLLHDPKSPTLHLKHGATLLKEQCAPAFVL